MRSWVISTIVINAITVLSLLYIIVRYGLSDGDTYLRHGERLTANNEHRMALRAYEQAIALEGNSFRAWKGLAKCYLSLDDPNRALDALNAALRYDEDDPWLWKSKGDACLAMKDSIQALEFYSAAFRLDPKNVGSCQRTGDLLRDLRQLEEAVTVYKTCLAADSTDAHLAHFWELIGALHIEKKDYEVAEAALETALQHDPDHLASWIKLSILFMGTGRLDEGIDALNRAVSLDHETGVAWYYRARIRAWRGETALARADLAMAIRMDSTIAIRARKKPELSFYFNRE